MAAQGGQKQQSGLMPIKLLLLTHKGSQRTAPGPVSTVLSIRSNLSGAVFLAALLDVCFYVAFPNLKRRCQVDSKTRL
jgi:hypothetical protein